MVSHASRTKCRRVVIIFALSIFLLSSISSVVSADETPEPIGVRSGQFRDDFNDETKSTLSGKAILKDGFLTLNNYAWGNDFQTLDDWTVNDVSGAGTVSLDGGEVTIIAGPTRRTEISKPIDMVDIRVSVQVSIDVLSDAGPQIWLTTSTGHGFSGQVWRHPQNLNILRILKVIPGQNTEGVKEQWGMNIPVRNWVPMEMECHRDGTIIFWLAGQKVEKEDLFFDGNITTLGLSTSVGGKCRFKELKVWRSHVEGEAVSDEVMLPAGTVWDQFEEDSTAKYPQLLRLSILDDGASSWLRGCQVHGPHGDRPCPAPVAQTEGMVGHLGLHIACDGLLGAFMEGRVL
jgi:hypothetical protein